jgi:subtilisin family serine protease
MARPQSPILAALLWAASAPLLAEVPECPPVEPGAQLSGEAVPADEAPSILLILPKGADGSISTDGLELGEGARVVESRFSPLLCATVARVAGEQGAVPASLLVRLPEGAAAVDDDAYALEGAPDLEAAPPAGAARSDPYRKQQWALDALGVDAARAITRGEGARLALLDTRANEQHPELRAVRVAGNGGPPAGQHGTLVAGIIGATEGNGAGIAGIAPRAALISVPVCEPEPRGDLCRLYRVLAGLDLAWGERVHVVNASLVGPANRALERAVRRLDTLGVAIVAATGNRASGAPTYPAAYPWVIGVAATDPKRQIAPTSALVDLTAPGVEIVSTAANGGYAFASGSSLAAAHASGALALLTAVSGGDVASARLALFGAARRAGPKEPPALAPLCDALARLGKPCGARR